MQIALNHVAGWQALLNLEGPMQCHSEGRDVVTQMFKDATFQVTARTADARKQLQQQETWNGKT